MRHSALPRQLVSSESLWSRRLLARLAEVYREEKSKAFMSSPAETRLLEQAARYAVPRLTEREQALSRRCKLECDRGRRFAEAGEQPEACRALAIAAAICRDGGLSEEARLLCLAEVVPAEAHVERIYGNWSGARLLVERALLLDMELEERFGHTIKVAHRLHLLTVSAALSLEQGDTTEGVKKLSRCLRLLGGESVGIEEPGEWRQARIDTLPASAREVIALQAIEVLYAAAASLGTVERGNLLQIVAPFPVVNRPKASAGQVSTRRTNGAADYLETLQASQIPCAAYFFNIALRLEAEGPRGLFHLMTLDGACRFLETGRSEVASSLARESLAEVRRFSWPMAVLRRLGARVAGLIVCQPGTDVPGRFNAGMWGSSSEFGTAP